MNLLFICSRNQWRSPTAEKLFDRHPQHQARSAGTEQSARVRVNGKLLHWADLIFVMERKHKERLQQYFSEEIQGKELVILDIPDEYNFMDPELIQMLEGSLNNFLAR